MRTDGLIEEYASGGLVAPSSEGIIFCEEKKLVDTNKIKYQNEIRFKLILALYDILEKSINEDMVDWPEWIKEAGVSNQDFSNNEKILLKKGWIKIESPRDYSITSIGKEIAKDYRLKIQKLNAFENLLKLADVTEQKRGHELENLLADIAEYEKWNVDKRVSAPGEEIDIVMNKGLNYFFCSCKWVKNPIQPHEVDLLESRVRDRASTKGVLFSMSGFTPNCIDKIRSKISSSIIIPFGPVDIENIFRNKTSLSDLIEQKIDKIMKHKKILIDNILR